MSGSNISDGFSAARAASRDRLAKEYDHELSRTVTGRPQVDPRYSGKVSWRVTLF